MAKQPSKSSTARAIDKTLREIQERHRDRIAKAGAGTPPQTDTQLSSSPKRRRGSPPLKEKAARPARKRPTPSGRYENNLAEFPLFRFSRKGQRSTKEPLLYEDSIRGHDGKRVPRIWRVYPGRHGFGGHFAQKVLFILLQLYYEQGACGDWIYFGTQRKLLERLGVCPTGKKTYTELRKAIDTLRGYDIHCENGFWDRSREAYIDKRWHLFGDVEYAWGARPNLRQEELPFCRIQVSDVLQQIGQTGGIFGLGFSEELFLEMSDLEARASLYLAKWFMSYSHHWRLVEDIARAWPIEDQNPRKVRLKIRTVCDALIERHQLPILDGYEMLKGSSGYRVDFFRKEKPKGDGKVPAFNPADVPNYIHVIVEDMVALTGAPESRGWFAHAASRLGPEQANRALSEAKGFFLEGGKVKKSRAAALGGFINTIAAEQGISLKRPESK